MIIITGMHRSGTSMVANLMAEMGLWIGHPNQWLPAGAHNIKGHFEFRPAVETNDAILDVFGGNWMTYPYINWWQDYGKVIHLVPVANNVIARLRNKPGATFDWGWKDPRTGVTLPFWMKLLRNDEMKIIMCVRHPAAVMKSIQERDNIDNMTVLDAWVQYYKEALRNSFGLKMKIVDYDAILQEPLQIASQLVSFMRPGFLNMDFVKDKVDNVIDTSMRHHNPEVPEWELPPVYDNAIDMYRRILDYAARFN